MSVEIDLPAEVTARIIDSLRRAGTREIGGVLMGECLEPNHFRVVDVTIQARGGSFARFIRSLTQILAPLERFFSRTHQDYRRFNYLGEWHSHPAFTLAPSACDLNTLREIVADRDVGATFAILLIVRLGSSGNLEGSATTFIPGQAELPSRLVIEDAT